VHHAEQLHRQLLQRRGSERDAVFDDLEGIRGRAGNQPNTNANTDTNTDTNTNANANTDTNANTGRS
jgi:hypothetical protein